MRNVAQDFADITHPNKNQRILNLIRICGFDSIRVQYSGGGDSGGVDHLDFIRSKDSTNNLEVISKLEKDLQELLEDPLSDPIWDEHGSFADAGGHSINGCVIWNAADNNVCIEGEEHYWDYDEDDEVTDEYDDPFHNDIYEFEPHYDYSQDGKPDYEYVPFYCEIISNSVLPTNLHNLMLSEGLKGNSSAKYYADWCEKKLAINR